MNSVLVGKAVIVKKSYTILGTEFRTYSLLWGGPATILVYSWVKILVAIRQYIQVRKVFHELNNFWKNIFDSILNWILN